VTADSGDHDRHGAQARLATPEDLSERIRQRGFELKF
jgi:hypothetical protein